MKNLRRIRPANLHPEKLRSTFKEVDNLLSIMKLAGEDIDNTAYKTMILEKFPNEVIPEVQAKSLQQKLTIEEIPTRNNKFEHISTSANILYSPV